MPWNMVGDYSFSSSQMLLDNTIEVSSSLPVSECKILIVTWAVSVTWRWTARALGHYYFAAK